jgi:hypothetical protein
MMQDPWTNSESEDRYARQATPPQFRAQTAGAPQPYQQPQFQPVGQSPPRPLPQQAPHYSQPEYPPPQQLLRKTSLTAAEQFWYILMCIGFGAGYFAKIPAKKAMHDFGLAEMTAAEKFWYVLMCIPFGAGYFAKVPVAKAITEMPAQPGYR